MPGFIIAICVIVFVVCLILLNFKKISSFILKLTQKKPKEKKNKEEKKKRLTRYAEDIRPVILPTNLKKDTENSFVIESKEGIKEEALKKRKEEMGNFQKNKNVRVNRNFLIIEEITNKTKLKLLSEDNKLVENSTMVIDGVDIDLNKIPPNLRKILINEVLDRPKFDD